jgi:methyl-accepting chemotaxis protein
MKTSQDARHAAFLNGRDGRDSHEGVLAFFRHHGIWAPGVRLFRRVGFAAKSTMISAAFAIPLAALGWGYFSQNDGQIAFSALERVGNVYLRALLPELDAAQDARAAAMRGEAVAAKDPAQLAQTQESLGATLGTATQWAAVQAARAELARVAPDAPVEQRFAAHGVHVSALLELMSQVADGSNLTLDPDVDTYYTMDAVTVKSPLLIETLSKVVDTGTAIGAAGRASAAQLTRADRLTSIAEVELAQLERGLGKVLEQRADLVATLSVEPASALVKQLLAAAATAFGPDGKPADAAALADTGRRAIALLRTAQRTQLETLDVGLAARISGLERARNLMGAIVLVTLLGAIYLFYAFYLVTRGGLREVASHIESMANGDLTRSPRPWGKDEAAGLMITLVGMQGSLRDIVQKVRAGSASIVQASTEISTGALDLSSRTEQTAANLEESAASMEEISSTVRLTADHARDGARIAGGNAEVARRGGAVIEDVVKTMNEIQQASGKIANIISVIDGIAFQTNILALNAAVEAARAGEQGRGFAVVAGEVRSLSHRSAEAAREIKSLIDATVAKVATGTQVVRSAGSTIQEIVATAEQLTTLSTAIADAASQQDAGVQQIGDAIQDLDRGAQQNAALVEQTAAAAGSLQEQAETLARTVAVFRLPGDTQPA